MTDHRDRPYLPQRRHDDPSRFAARGRVAVQHLDLDALNAYLDGRLDPAERAAAAAHLAECAACRGELTELR
ncbi:MAG: zf-HC2 domain-containing protein, partial [Chloroflexota bacterium]|nr:zf-HC2 domain-containing protein [Chloroflexota bacterium]